MVCVPWFALYVDYKGVQVGSGKASLHCPPCPHKGRTRHQEAQPLWLLPHGGDDGSPRLAILDNRDHENGDKRGNIPVATVEGEMGSNKRLPQYVRKKENSYNNMLNKIFKA